MRAIATCKKASCRDKSLKGPAGMQLQDNIVLFELKQGDSFNSLLFFTLRCYKTDEKNISRFPKGRKKQLLFWTLNSRSAAKLNL